MNIIPGVNLFWVHMAGVFVITGDDDLIANIAAWVELP